MGPCVAKRHVKLRQVVLKRHVQRIAHCAARNQLGDRFSGHEAAGLRAVIQDRNRPALVALFELGEGRLVAAGDDRVHEMDSAITSCTLENLDDFSALCSGETSESCRCADHSAQGFFR